MFGRVALRLVLAAVATLSVLLVAGQPASAHTDFESSTPADGEVLDAPVSEIVIRFTGVAEPAGEGFTVLDPSGAVRAPDSVTTVDGTQFVLGFDPPLGGGVVGVRWSIAASDAHPIDGSFSFTVDAPVPTTTSPTVAPASDPVAPVTSEPGADLAATTTVPAAAVDDEAAEDAAELADETSGVAGSSAGLPPGDDASTVSLDEFLTADAELPGETRLLVGRVVGFVGVVLAVGVFVFLGSAFRGRRDELRLGVMAVGIAGLAATVGGGIEYSGRLAQSGGTVLGELTSSPGSAAGLRLLGGIVVAAGAVVAARSASAAPAVTTRPLSASVLDRSADDIGDPQPVRERLRRWNPRSAPAVVVGAAILVVSFSFDGHTVSKGPRLVHALVNVVHVTAGAVWVGGVVALGALLILRRRRRVPGRAASLIVRFSGIAAVALAAVVAAGAVMAWMVLDSAGDLTDTEWGQVLLLKTAAVGVAALGGAYNHFRLRPRLEAAPDDVGLESEFRSSLVAEGIVLLFVVVTTAWLVAASTVA